MFTGIIEEISTIARITRGTQSGQIVIQAEKVLEDCKIGDSIAVNGACLTVIRTGADSFTADVSPETLRRTNLGELSRGDKVNLERSLKLQDRLGGHIVLGHVDEVGLITGMQAEDNATIMRVAVSSDTMRYIVQKGSVCVDGVSLTITNLLENSFDVSLIPHTKAVTTMGTKKVGDQVNIEVDILGRYVERLLPQETKQSSISTEFLSEHGFL